jgi:elongation factor P
MDENNKKYELDIEEIKDKARFIKKDLNITGIFYEDELINIELPVKAVYKVIYAPPGLKGDSEKSNYKIVTIETGAEISVPLFINEGDLIVINTEKGEYVERAK